MQSETFVKGLSSPEGPVQLSNGDFLIVEMGEDAGTVSYIDAKSKSVKRLAKTGRPNGLAVDRHENIWVAESMKPTLLRVTLGGEVEVVMDACEGESFVFPNDLAFGPDGILYMTDSGIPFVDFAPGGIVRSDYRTAEYNGKVFGIDLSKRTIYMIDDGIKFTNGIAVGPDGLLYVNESVTGNVYRYRQNDGRFDGSTRELFGNVIIEDGNTAYRGPDGMKFSETGKLYCTSYGQKNITVLDRAGKVDQRIETLGNAPTNIVFGLPGTKSFYVTDVEKGALELHHVAEDGLQLHLG